MADALGAKAHGGCALVTPAFPETGRTVYLGHLFVGSTPLNESPLKDHPLNPMHDSNLVRVLQRQSKGSVGLIDLMTVEQGSEAVSRARAELSAQGYGTAIVDAVFERDLEALGDAAAESAFSVGASGLGLGLARALARGRSAASHASTLEAVGGRAAILAGSCSRATLEQIAAVENEIPVLRLSTQKLIEDAEEIGRALAWAKEHIEAGPVLIASSEEPEQVAALQARYGRDKSGHAIEHALAEITSGLVALGVRRLAIAGGETSGAAVDRLGVSAFRLGAGNRAGGAAHAHGRAKGRRTADGAQVRQFWRTRLLHPRALHDSIEEARMGDETRARDEICEVGLSLFSRGLTFGSTGNISVRLPDGGWLMTPTNASLGKLDPANLSKFDSENRFVSGGKPTKEAFLHFCMYKERADARAVVHLHSTHSVAVSLLADVDPRDALPPLTAYFVMRVGRLPLAPYYPPGDESLAKAVGALAGKHHAVLLANHGPVVAGTSLENAQYATEELEETAKLFLMLRGEKIRPLTPAEVSDLRARYNLR